MNIFFSALSAEFGALAQLGERLHGMEEVESSILLRSTKLENQPSERAVFSLFLIHTKSLKIRRPSLRID